MNITLYSENITLILILRVHALCGNLAIMAIINNISPLHMPN